MKKIILVALIYILSACTAQPALLPAPEVRYVEAKLDFSKIQMPEDATSAIEAEGSAIYLDQQKLRVVFWKVNNTFQSTGHKTSYFRCIGDGVIFAKVDDWFVYYDCEKGYIAASKSAYPVVVDNYPSDWYLFADLKDITGSKTVEGWILSPQEDGSLLVTSPLGLEITVEKERTYTRTDDLRNAYENPVWLLSVSKQNILIKPTETGWQYATEN